MSVKLITNQKTTLSDIINNTLPKTADVRFLVGYFYYSGFQELYSALSDKKLKVLVGLDIDIDIMKQLTISHCCVLEITITSSHHCSLL